MNKIFTIVGVGIVVAITTLCFLYINLSQAPKDFPHGKNFIVYEDESLRSVSIRLQEEGFINSALMFRVWTSFTGKDRHVQLGEYEFQEAHSLGGVVKKLVSGKPDRPLVQVTIPEGSTIFEIATLVQKSIPTISVEHFINKVTELRVEGRLFPSTYFLLPSSKEESVIRLLNETFEKQFANVFGSLPLPTPLITREELISLAAILEGEAKGEEDMKLVAGILLARLERGMPLQVDVALETYKTKGVPPIPINNPGIVAMRAVFEPTPSPYLFYITGNDGKMYYAKTYEEHKRNIRKYLK